MSREALETPRWPKAGQQGGLGEAERPQHHHPLQPKNLGEALETLRRPTAGQQGGCRGGSAPPPKITTFSAGQQISGGQQGVQGGQRPPAQH